MSPAGGLDPLRVLVAGAGAVGQWLGLRLMQAGHDVTLLLRPVHAEAIRADGLRIHGERELHGHPACVTDAAQARKGFDAILLTCKAHQSADLVGQVASHLAPDGILVSLQNGFGNAQKAARHVPATRIALAPLSRGLMLERPGLLLDSGGGPTPVGPYAAAGETAARRAFALLEHAGADPQWSDDMRGHVWRKALVNHAVNPVGALHEAANGQLLDEPAWSQCRELALEGYSIARSTGVALPGVSGPEGLVVTVRSTLERTARNRNSMVQDVANQRPTEVEQISGRLVRAARRLGIAAPTSDEVYRKVKALEARYLGEEASLRMVREEVQWESEPF